MTPTPRTVRGHRFPSRHHSTGSGGEVRQQVVLLACQFEHRLAEPRGTPRRIKNQIADADFTLLNHGGRGDSAAPQHRADSRGEVSRSEWLRDVVVGARVKQADHVGFRTPGRRDDHRYVADGPQHAQHIRAVEIRQSEVEDHEIGALVGGPRRDFLDGGERRPHRQDRMSGVGKCVCEGTTNRGVVLHEEYERHQRTVTEVLLANTLRQSQKPFTVRISAGPISCRRSRSTRDSPVGVVLHGGITGY